MTTNRRCHDGISRCYSGSGTCNKGNLPKDWNGNCAYQDRPDWWQDPEACAWSDDGGRRCDAEATAGKFCSLHALALDWERMEREGK